MKKLFILLLLLTGCGTEAPAQLPVSVFTHKILFSPPPCDAFPMYINKSEAPVENVNDALTIDEQVFGTAPIIQATSAGFQINIEISDGLPNNLAAATDLNRDNRTCTIGFHSSLLSDPNLLSYVLAHEFGHCFGYFHSDPNSGCLMAGIGGDGANCDYSELKPYLQTCGE